MTPYQKHKQANHKESRYSENGINIIVECLDGCGLSFIMPFKGQADQYPVSFVTNKVD